MKDLQQGGDRTDTAVSKVAGGSQPDHAIPAGSAPGAPLVDTSARIAAGRLGTASVNRTSKAHEIKQVGAMKAAKAPLAATLTWVVTAVAVGGCSTHEAQQGAADCSAQVRADGVVYTSHGYTERRAVKFSSAEEADCHDVGRDAAGSVFPDSPRRVTTWTFVGHQPAKVLGVRFDEDSFAVFVADSVAPDERERILGDLTSDAS